MQLQAHYFPIRAKLQSKLLFLLRLSLSGDNMDKLWEGLQARLSWLKPLPQAAPTSRSHGEQRAGEYAEADCLGRARRYMLSLALFKVLYIITCTVNTYRTV